MAILYQSISTIKEHLESELSSEEQLSLSSILDCLGDLLTLLPQLANKWQEHSNNIEIRHLSSRYQVPVQESSHRGHPCLNVTQEQRHYHFHGQILVEF